MMKRFVLFAFAVVVLVSIPVPSLAQEDAAADPQKLTEQVEKLLAAYNKDDAKAFYAQGWSAMVKEIATEQTYDALYKNGAKKTVGDYVAKSLKLRKEGSVLTGDFLVVYFDAEFSKEKAGQVAVNFAKEDGGYKFVQVQMSKKQ